MAYNVLVVDDSSTTRNIIAKALRHAGVELGEIHFASDGAEALRVLEGVWVDIVFADLNMPGVSGVELVEAMADSNLLASVPVVIVSTEGRQERVDSLLQRGAAAFLRKPFAPEQIGAITRQLLGEQAPVEEADDLDEAFFSAVEGFAMLVAEPIDTPERPADALLAQMGFEGPSATGRVSLMLPSGGSRSIAEAATGQATDEAGGTDALKELLNVLVGHLADSLHGGPFRLELPVVTADAGVEAWEELLACDVVRSYDIEGVPVLVALDFGARW